VDGAHDIFDAHLRLHKVAVGAEGFTTGTLVVARKRGHHNYLYVFCFRGAAKDVEHVKTANLWHHDVADDEVGAFFDGHCEGFFTVTC
jgi:hypothetical protein